MEPYHEPIWTASQPTSYTSQSVAHICIRIHFGDVSSSQVLSKLKRENKTNSSVHFIIQPTCVFSRACSMIGFCNVPRFCILLPWLIMPPMRFTWALYRRGGSDSVSFGTRELEYMECIVIIMFLKNLHLLLFFFLKIKTQNKTKNLNKCLLTILNSSSACALVGSIVFGLPFFPLYIFKFLQDNFSSLCKLAMKWGTTHICTIAACWWEILREPIEGCLEIVNKCPCNAISHAKGNWELTLGYQLSCELSQKWFCKLKKIAQSIEIERSSEFIFNDSLDTLSKKKQNFKRLTLVDPVTWKIFSLCYFNMTFIDV